MKKNKPFYKIWWFWVVLIAAGIIGLVTTGNEDKSDDHTASITALATPMVTAKPTTESSPSPATESTSKATAEPTTVPTLSPSAERTVNPTQATSADQVPLSADEVLAYTANLTSKTFIKDVNVGTDNITVTFFETYQAYKEANPTSGITKEDYIDYFSTGDQINKLLMEETSRLFAQFPGAASIDMVIPYDGKIYSVALTQGEIERFYNVDFSTLASNEIWREKVSNPHFNKRDRQQFVEQFVQVN
ncbi:hypothetical protein [Paenibacillus sp. IHBB 3054]|uniref:hypothetical protein n=1 Tax=Paenibacillus sp. IHBB 3054 TaxID=3425689 RepID=UPI003F66AF20